MVITGKQTGYKAWDSHKRNQSTGERLKMSDNEFKVKLNAESHIDELVQASRLDKKSGKDDRKNHLFAKDGFTYRTAYFRDFDGKYYRFRISIGHNGTTATVYNVVQTKEDTLPAANIVAAVGSKAMGKYPLKHSISESGENVNSSSKKSYFVSEADDGMDSDVTAKARRELQQDAELERFVHRRSKRCGRMPGLLRRFSKKQKRRHLCIVFRIELKRVHEIASL